NLINAQAPETVQYSLSVSIKSNDGRLDTDRTRPAIKDVRDLVAQLFIDVFGARRTDISKGICTWCRQWKRQLLQQCLCEGMRRSTQAYFRKARRDQVGYRFVLLQEQREGTRPECFCKRPGFLRDVCCVPCGLGKTGYVNDDGIEARPILHGKYGRDCPVIERVARETVHRLCGDRHQSPCFQLLSCFSVIRSILHHEPQINRFFCYPRNGFYPLNGFDTDAVADAGVHDIVYFEFITVREP